MSNRFLSLALFPLLLLAACNNTAEKKEKPFPIYDERAAIDTSEGMLGVYNVPDMLIVSVLDSADEKNLALKVAQSYRLLGEEISATGIETEGPPGQIMYNNDPENFKFECFSGIKKLPVVQPAKSKVSTLPAADMLIYNYYGPYQQLYQAYSQMRLYISTHELEQKGSVREFYISDPNAVPDSTNWLTKVMVPVARIKKEEKKKD